MIIKEIEKPIITIIGDKFQILSPSLSFYVESMGVESFTPITLEFSGYFSTQSYKNIVCFDLIINDNIYLSSYNKKPKEKGIWTIHNNYSAVYYDPKTFNFCYQIGGLNKGTYKMSLCAKSPLGLFIIDRNNYPLTITVGEQEWLNIF